MSYTIEIANLSDVGKVRTVNEDYFGSYQGEFGNMIIVCDGMGGHKGGYLASRLAVETIKTHFENLPPDYNAQDELRAALQKADEIIKQKASEDLELSEMGTTAVVLLIKDDTCFYTNIGDSRIYHIRNDKITQITKDHSLVQQMVDNKIIDAMNAENHPNRNIITHSLGPGGNSTPDIFPPMKILQDDLFILCTDGLTKYVSDLELFEISTKHSPRNACELLIGLANTRGGRDNITVQIVAVMGQNSPLKEKIKFQIQQKVILITLVSLFVLIIGFLSLSGISGSDSKEKNIPDSLSSAKKDTLIDSNTKTVEEKADTLSKTDTTENKTPTLTSPDTTSKMNTKKEDKTKKDKARGEKK